MASVCDWATRLPRKSCPFTLTLLHVCRYLRLCRSGRVVDGDCTYAATVIATGNPLGEIYGADSYCFTGTLVSNQ